MTRRTLVGGGAAALAAFGAHRLDAAASGSDGFESIGPFGTGVVTRRPERLDAPDQVTPWTFGVIGHTESGTPIERWDVKPVGAARHVVVICGVHGDERASYDLASRIGGIEVPDDMHFTIVPLLNPDGFAVGERNNARDVDLNRNFAWGWNPRAFAGPAAGSELETQAAMALLTRKRPDLTIWVHQPLGYVAGIGDCPPDYPRHWAFAAGVPNRRGLVQVGGGETWTAKVLDLPSMLIEVGGTRIAPVGVERHVTALETLLPLVRSSSPR